MPRATLLLPAAARFGKQGLRDVAARAFGRADRITHVSEGRRSQLLRYFSLVPNHWPIAALTRQVDAGDAALSAWLRADPAYVQPDINGARLLACGDMLQLTEADSAAMLPDLKPLFGDLGFPIDAPSPSRWYLRVPRESKLPAFTDPENALGDDLFEHLAEGVDGRRWRAVLSEAQVVLHNHPWNAQRVAQGKLPVNSLWFWGGGVLPDFVQRSHDVVCTDEETMRALAAASLPSSPETGSIPPQPLPPRFATVAGDALFDLQAERDLARLQDGWLEPALLAAQRGELDSLQIDFADGAVFTIKRMQRWRIWRKPLASLNP
ncbi:MAG: phosphoglycerate mutase [Pseudomonadota bacterium]|nr:phosphoglycerate mutase [Pseudomonadota bacterium]